MKILKIDWTPSMRWGLGFSNSRTSPFEQVEQLSAFLRREACVKSSFPTYLRCCSFNDTNCVSTSSFPSICSTLQVKVIAKVNRCNKLKKTFCCFYVKTNSSLMCCWYNVNRHVTSAESSTHGQVQSTESENAGRELRQNVHQLSALVSWHRHSRPGHHGAIRSRVWSSMLISELSTDDVG